VVGVSQVSEPKHTLSCNVFIIREIRGVSEWPEFAFQNGIGYVKMVAFEYIDRLTSEG
jgi:hypothetical protein